MKMFHRKYAYTASVSQSVNFYEGIINVYIQSVCDSHEDTDASYFYHVLHYTHI